MDLPPNNNHQKYPKLEDKISFLCLADFGFGGISGFFAKTSMAPL